MTDVMFVQPSYLDGKEKVVEYAVIVESPERVKRAGIYIPTGRNVLRTSVYFTDGTMTRTKSKHFVSFFGNLEGKVTEIPGGFRVDVNRKIRFYMEPTEYANGEFYDVIAASEPEGGTE